METVSAGQDQFRRVLRKLDLAANHTGYKQLLTVILLYAQDSSQSITKELYPALSKQYQLYTAVSIERSIRYAISEAWNTEPTENGIGCSCITRRPLPTWCS